MWRTKEASWPPPARRPGCFRNACDVCKPHAKGVGPTDGSTHESLNPSITIAPGNPSDTTTLGDTTNPLGTAPSTNTRSGLISTRGVSPSRRVPMAVAASYLQNSTITLKSGSFVYRRSSSVPTCKTPGCSSVDKYEVASDWPLYQDTSAVRCLVLPHLKSWY